MAAQKAYTATLQPLHAPVLKRRVLGARIHGRCNMSGILCELAEVIRISYSRLAGLRIVNLQPGADLVLVPDIIVVAEKIGLSMHAADDPDLIYRHPKAVVKTI